VTDLVAIVEVWLYSLATFSRGFSFVGVPGKGGREVPPLVAHRPSPAAIRFWKGC